MMRKHGWILLTICVVLTAFAPFAAAQTNAKTVRKELGVWYGKAVDAYKRKDAKSYATLFSPDVETTSWDDKKIVGRKAMEEYAREDMATIESISSAREVIHKITIRGDKVTRDSTDIWKYKMIDVDGTYGAKGKKYDVLWKQKGRGTFVKTANGWQLQSGYYLSKPALTVGGKPLRPLK